MQDSVEGQTSPCERQSSCKHSDGRCLTSHVEHMSEAEQEHAPSLDEIQVSLSRKHHPGGSAALKLKNLQRSRRFPELGTQIQENSGLLWPGARHTSPQGGGRGGAGMRQPRRRSAFSR